MDSAIEEFSKRRHVYARFTTKLETLVRDLLSAESLEVHLIESRTKDVVSLREKLTRGSKAYRDALSDVTDLCGLRVIAYYQDQVDAIGRLITSEFAVDDSNSLVHTATGAEFGYKSSHYVVKLKPERAALREWHGLGELCAEIQVRTVLQHAWAAISHKLQYKREEDVPNILKRKLFRLSALFELADDEFVSLRDASGAVRKEIVEQFAGGNRQLPLDTVSLARLIDTSHEVAELCALAENAGFNFEPPEYEDEETDIDDRTSDLLKLASIAELKTVSDFDAMLADAMTWGGRYLKAQFEADQSMSPGNWHVTPPFICELILLHAHASAFKFGHLLKVGYSRLTGKRIYEVAQSFGRMDA